MVRFRAMQWVEPKISNGRSFDLHVLIFSHSDRKFAYEQRDRSFGFVRFYGLHSEAVLPDCFY